MIHPGSYSREQITTISNLNNNIVLPNVLEITTTQPKHPSFFERLMHIVDMCAQVWDIDLYRVVHEVIPNEDEYQQFVNSLINIDHASEHYKNFTEPHFSLQCDRVKIDPNYQGFNFIKDTRIEQNK